MAETGFTSSGQVLSGAARVRSTGLTTPAQSSRQTGNEESGFNGSLQGLRSLSGKEVETGTATFQNSPVPGGNALLSTSVLFALAETRTQEANASGVFPAPSNLGRAIGSYVSVDENIRRTISKSASNV